jgi:hypothetical protein
MQFLLREVQHAISPGPGVAWSVLHWNEIAHGLHEAPRGRRTQRQRLDINMADFDGYS